MAKTTVNTFTKGMVKDIPEMLTPATVYTDALNATLISGNGNEMILLNDYGNAPIKNNSLGEGDSILNHVLLTPGFIPVGSIEDRGIWYIASWNPETEEGEIGTYPSPSYKGDNLRINFNWRNYLPASYEVEGGDPKIRFYIRENEKITELTESTKLDNYPNYKTIKDLTDLVKYTICTGGVFNKEDLGKSEANYVYLTPGKTTESYHLVEPIYYADAYKEPRNDKEDIYNKETNKIKDISYKNDGAQLQAGDYLRFKGITNEINDSEEELIILSNSGSEYTCSINIDVLDAEQRVVQSLNPYKETTLEIEKDGKIKTEVIIGNNSIRKFKISWVLQYFYTLLEQIYPLLLLKIECIDTDLPIANKGENEFNMKLIFLPTDKEGENDDEKYKFNNLYCYEYLNEAILNLVKAWKIPANSVTVSIARGVDYNENYLENKLKELYTLLYTNHVKLGTNFELDLKNLNNYICKLFNNAVLYIYSSYSDNFKSCIKNFYRQGSLLLEENLTIVPWNPEISIAPYLNIIINPSLRLNVSFSRWRYKYFNKGMLLDFNFSIIKNEDLEIKECEFILLGKIDTSKLECDYLKDWDRDYIPVNYAKKLGSSDIIFPSFIEFSGLTDNDRRIQREEGSNGGYLMGKRYNTSAENPLNYAIIMKEVDNVINFDLPNYVIKDIVNGALIMYGVILAKVKDKEEPEFSTKYYIVPIFLCSAINKYYNFHKNYLNSVLNIFYDNEINPQIGILDVQIAKDAFLKSINYKAKLYPKYEGGIVTCDVKISPTYSEALPYEQLRYNYKASNFKSYLNYLGFNDYVTSNIEGGLNGISISPIDVQDIEPNVISFRLKSGSFKYNIDSSILQAYLLKLASLDADFTSQIKKYDTPLLKPLYSLVTDINNIKTIEGLETPYLYFWLSKVFLDINTYLDVTNADLKEVTSIFKIDSLGKYFYKVFLDHVFIDPSDESKGTKPVLKHLYIGEGSVWVFKLKGEELFPCFIPTNIYSWESKELELNSKVTYAQPINWPDGDKFYIDLETNPRDKYSLLIRNNLPSIIKNSVSPDMIEFVVDSIPLDLYLLLNKEISVLIPEYIDSIEIDENLNGILYLNAGGIKMENLTGNVDVDYVTDLEGNSYRPILFQDGSLKFDEREYVNNWSKFNHFMFKSHSATLKSIYLGNNVSVIRTSNEYLWKVDMPLYTWDSNIWYDPVYKLSFSNLWVDSGNKSDSKKDVFIWDGKYEFEVTQVASLTRLSIKIIQDGNLITNFTTGFCNEYEKEGFDASLVGICIYPNVWNLTSNSIKGEIQNAISEIKKESNEVKNYNNKIKTCRGLSLLVKGLTKSDLAHSFNGTIKANVQKKYLPKTIYPLLIFINNFYRYEFGFSGIHYIFQDYIWHFEDDGSGHDTAIENWNKIKDFYHSPREFAYIWQRLMLNHMRYKVLEKDQEGNYYGDVWTCGYHKNNVNHQDVLGYIDANRKTYFHISESAFKYIKEHGPNFGLGEQNLENGKKVYFHTRGNARALYTPSDHINIIRLLQLLCWDMNTDIGNAQWREEHSNELKFFVGYFFDFSNDAHYNDVLDTLSDCDEYPNLARLKNKILEKRVSSNFPDDLYIASENLISEDYLTQEHLEHTGSIKVQGLKNINVIRKEIKV